MKKTYQPTWNSLRTHQTPQWFQQAKFGIYTHWGVYCVPAYGPNATWYPYNMYRPGSGQYDYHVKTYGGPEKFGYKDFIPEFTGAKFDADEWAELFRGAGAQYAGPVGEHHDGFCMWNSAYTDWKAPNMGPKRDVVGELAKAYRQQDMRFMVALHHAENWWFFPHWRKEFDVSDPRYSGLYGELHNVDKDPGEGVEGFDRFFVQDKPSKAFLELWKNKTCEVIDKYQPDMLWFDFALKGIQEHYKRELLAYYYNRADEWGKEVLVTYKWHDLVPGAGIVDLELGRFDELTYQMWLTDTTVDNGEGWGYLNDQKYKQLSTLVHYLIDNVSKNGYLLLNVGPKPNGEIPDEAKSLLAGMGKWLKVNGDAIYGTTPWMTYGEGPTKMEKGGPFMEDAEVKYTPQDFRFTTKDDTIYAISLGQPTGEVTIESFKALYPGEISSVSMLGVEQPLEWALTDDGLKIIPPSDLPSENAVTFKIARQHPFRCDE
jgi:alpha-L-fucosidase